MFWIALAFTISFLVRGEPTQELNFAFFPALIPLITTGIGALSGGLSGRKQGQTSQTQSGTRQESGTQDFSNLFNRSTNPLLPEDSLGLRGQLFGDFGNLLRQPSNLAQSQLDQLQLAERARIGRQTGNLQRDLQRTLQQQGLSGSAAAALQRGALENFRSSQFGGLAQQLNEARQRALQFDEGNRLDRLQTAAGFLSSIPVGQSQTGTESGTRNVTGTTSFQNTGTSQQQGPGFLSGLAGGALETFGHVAPGLFNQTPRFSLPDPVLTPPKRPALGDLNVPPPF